MQLKSKSRMIYVYTKPNNDFFVRLVHRLYLNKSASTPQIQYQIIFCLWLLTFEKDIAAEINQ